jgi:hypothetical protein
VCVCVCVVEGGRAVEIDQLSYFVLPFLCLYMSCMYTCTCTYHHHVWVYAQIIASREILSQAPILNTTYMPVYRPTICA